MVTADDGSSGKFAVCSELSIYLSTISIHFFYKRVYLKVLHIPLIMHYICIIRGSSLIKLGSLQDNRKYITERSVLRSVILWF